MDVAPQHPPWGPMKMSARCAASMPAIKLFTSTCKVPKVKVKQLQFQPGKAHQRLRQLRVLRVAWFCQCRVLLAATGQVPTC